MKKILFVFCPLLPIMASAQVFVSTSTMYSSGTVMMAANQVTYLKSAKTYFIVPESMKDQTESLTASFKKVWTFNELKVVSLAEAANMPAGKKAFFNITGYINEDVMYILMRLSIDIPKGDAVFKKPGEQIFAAFYLAADVGKYSELLKLYRTHGSQETLFRPAGDDQASKDYNDFYYVNTTYHNMYEGQILTYLAIINDGLEDAATRPRGAWGLLKITDETGLADLKTETLYVPDYLLKTQKMVMGSISTSTTTEAELMADYKYPYKMTTSEEISKLIVSSTEAVYYLDFISSNLYSFLVVFNSKTHQPVYAKLVNSTIPSSKIFKEIVAKIDSGAK
jgi:hypothetical protein